MELVKALAVLAVAGSSSEPLGGGVQAPPASVCSTKDDSIGRGGWPQHDGVLSLKVKAICIMVANLEGLFSLLMFLW